MSYDEEDDVSELLLLDAGGGLDVQNNAVVVHVRQRGNAGRMPKVESRHTLFV